MLRHHLLDTSHATPAATDRRAHTRGTVLVVSGERVGRAFIVQTLRSQGLGTLLADDARQAMARIQNGQQPIDAIAVVGQLTDATAESLQRWLRSEGHTTLPLIAVGAELATDDPFATTIETQDWLERSIPALQVLGLGGDQRQQAA